MNWDAVEEKYSSVLKEGTMEEPASGVFTLETEDGEERWQDLRKRVIEHVSILLLLISIYKQLFKFKHGRSFPICPSTIFCYDHKHHNAVFCPGYLEWWLDSTCI